MHQNYLDKLKKLCEMKGQSDLKELIDVQVERERKLRFLLWMNHGHRDYVPLYGDDGEMQCPACFIDFKRDDPGEIHRKIVRFNMTQLTNRPVFSYGSCGALLCDRQIAGITQALDRDASDYYGDKHFVCETINRSAAKQIAILLGGVFREG